MPSVACIVEGQGDAASIPIILRRIAEREGIFDPPVTGAQVTDVLGTDVLKQFAAKAGVPHQEAGGLLAALLPTVIDHLTPKGEVPAAPALESSLGGLLSSLMK